MSIQRIGVGPRMSGAVVHGDTVYLSGHVSKEPAGSVRGQTQAILERIDERLAEAGTDRSRLLSASVWLTDITTFDEMNAVWEAWIDPANPPTRATVEARLASPDYLVEIAVIAAR
ncbi:MAG TPA: RidA family protein [Candidatus Eisenbacteria bacterium]|nr:RidA family protein [Candidatus Eisenbacteria bacterium]